MMVTAEMFVVVHLSAINSANPVELRVKGNGQDEGMDKTGVLALGASSVKSKMEIAAKFRAEVNLAAWPADEDATRAIAQAALQAQISDSWSIGNQEDEGHTWGADGWKNYNQGVETPRAFALEKNGNAVYQTCTVRVKQAGGTWQNETLYMPLWVVFQKKI